MSAGIKRRNSEVRQLVFSKSPLRVVIQSGLIQPGEDLAIPQLRFFTPDFLASCESRSFFICTKTGLPIEDPKEVRKETETKSVNRIAVEVFINQPIVSFNQIVGDNGNFRFISVGCTERTHYVVIRGNVSFTFYAPFTSITPKDAVHALLNNNFIEGPRLYEKTAIIVQDFFYLIMAAVYPERDTYETTIKTITNLTLKCRVYFDPDKPKDSGISIEGYMYPFDMNTYPKPQLNRALRKMTKDELHEKYIAPRSIAFMTRKQKSDMEALIDEMQSN